MGRQKSSRILEDRLKTFFEKINPSKSKVYQWSVNLKKKYTNSPVCFPDSLIKESTTSRRSQPFYGKFNQNLSLLLLEEPLITQPFTRNTFSALFCESRLGLPFLRFTHSTTSHPKCVKGWSLGFPNPVNRQMSWLSWKKPKDNRHLPWQL